MASSYPTATDTMLNPATTLGGPEAHSNIEIKQNDAIAAVQVEMGLDPAGAFATVAARVANIESQLSGLGDPQWQTFAPNFTGIAAFSSTTGRYIQLGELVVIFATGTVQTLGNGPIYLNLPVFTVTDFEDAEGGFGIWYMDTVGGNRMWAHAKIWPGGKRIYPRRARDLGVSGGWECDQSNPTTWNAGDVITFTGFYEAL